jgi:hypothetical protein
MGSMALKVDLSVVGLILQTLMIQPMYLLIAVISFNVIQPM